MLYDFIHKHTGFTFTCFAVGRHGAVSTGEERRKDGREGRKEWKEGKEGKNARKEKRKERKERKERKARKEGKHRTLKIWEF